VLITTVSGSLVTTESVKVNSISYVPAVSTVKEGRTPT